MKQYKLLIFDWEGTLMDSIKVIVKAFAATAAELELPQPDVDVIRNHLGLPLTDQVYAQYSHINGEMFVDFFRRKYGELREEVDLFPNALSVLQKLYKAGYLLAVATSKYRSGLEEVLQRYNISNLFATTACGDDGYTKPDPQVLLGIMTKLNVEADAAVMIGDTEYDMLMANQAGVDAIAVTYGVQRKEKLLPFNPVACIDDISELSALFL